MVAESVHEVDKGEMGLGPVAAMIELKRDRAPQPSLAQRGYSHSRAVRWAAVGR
jgi:hypothetical protein